MPTASADFGNELPLVRPGRALVSKHLNSESRPLMKSDLEYAW